MATEEHDDNDDTAIWIKPIPTERRKLMHSLGVPMQDFMPFGQRFDVTKFLITMEPNVPGVINKPIAIEKQIKSLRAILKDPFKQPHLIGISSYPSDARAKYLAHTIMSRAIDVYEEDRKRFGARIRPSWHRVWGNLRDNLREGTEQPFTMLAISNIGDESQSVKIEKVRDLLEMYNHVPRIVVAAGAPIVDLFTFRLQLRATACLYIGPNSLVTDLPK